MCGENVESDSNVNKYLAKTVDIFKGGKGWHSYTKWKLAKKSNIFFFIF